ncbi:MAG: hypothetical protein R3Y09_00555 [Clostridia bacterium]
MLCGELEKGEKELNVKKDKIILTILLIISIVSTTTSLYWANELKQERAINQEQTEILVHFYQLAFANGTDDIKSSEISEETVSSLLKALESSMVYYNIGITYDGHRTAYLAVMNTYMSKLQAFLDEKNENYEIDTVVSDLIIIGDWLGKRNINEVTAFHNDEDFYKVYLRLSSDLIDEHERYFE